MSAAPPELPATDNPFELLGIELDGADERSVKRAYARLIKVYRPDRAPDEFARVHEAFERARWVLSMRASLVMAGAEANPDDVLSAIVGDRPGADEAAAAGEAAPEAAAGARADQVRAAIADIARAIDRAADADAVAR